MVDMGQADRGLRTVLSSDNDGVFARHRERVAALRYHWKLTDDFGNEVNLDSDYGSLTIDAAFEFYLDGRQSYGSH